MMPQQENMETGFGQSGSNPGKMEGPRQAGGQGAAPLRVQNFHAQGAAQPTTEQMQRAGGGHARHGHTGGWTAPKAVKSHLG